MKITKYILKLKNEKLYYSYSLIIMVIGIKKRLFGSMQNEIYFFRPSFHSGLS